MFQEFTSFLQSIRYGILILVLVFPSASSWAADISLRLDVQIRGTEIDLSVRNTGADEALAVRLDLELAGKHYKKLLTPKLLPDQRSTATIEVLPPAIEGSYPLITTVQYLDGDLDLSLVNVEYFNFGQEELLTSTASLPNVELSQVGTISISHKTGERVSLILPREIRIFEEEDLGTITRFRIRSLWPEIRLNTPIFGVIESEGTRHATKILSARLRTRMLSPERTWFSGSDYCLGLIIGLSVSFYLFSRRGTSPSLTTICLIRWGFNVFLLSGLFLIFRYGHCIPDWLLPHLSSGAGAEDAQSPWLKTTIFHLLNWLYFSGENYDYFMRYVSDPLYLFMLLGSYPTLRYLIRPEVSSDKYWQLISDLFSKLLRQSRGERSWHSASTQALRALVVKAFFVPYLTSWSINNIFHQIDLCRVFSFDFYKLNEFLVALFILVDVFIFGIGYLTELPQLKNKIRSVEPTLFGWMVCLMCYPPFNQFSFVLFDHSFSDHSAPPTAGLKYAALTLITVLWAIYVWATIALGFKASNLTNRGTVASGPYRFIRHPAYVSKVLLWCIECGVLGARNVSLMIALVVVYWLRAVTEERHLSSDPDYEAYKKVVRWRFVPGIY